MLFFLSKTIGAIAILPNLVAAWGITGISLMCTRYASVGRKLIIGSFAALVVCGLTPLGTFLLQPLEERFPPWTPTVDSPTGIVVLGGTTKPQISAARGLPVSDIGVDRLFAAAMLARRYPNARIIYSGGSPALRPGDAKESDYALQILQELGIARDRVEIEGNSRNTAENASYSKILAAPQAGERWLLVTSAFHMPRAIGLFRRAGFAVEAAPTGWLTGGNVPWIDIGNFASSILLVHIASREWIGLATYRTLGKTDAFFPRP